MARGLLPVCGASIVCLVSALGTRAEITVTDEQGRSEVIYDVGILHPMPGAQITHDYCTACHSEMIIAQQGQTREGWDDILVWMVEDMGMNEIDEEDRNLILDYLAAYYNPDRPHSPLN
ncbi:MAG: aldehyde dehydrogenase [Pseudomonadota bacterium]